MDEVGKWDRLICRISIILAVFIFLGTLVMNILQFGTAKPELLLWRGSIGVGCLLIAGFMWRDYQLRKELERMRNFNKKLIMAAGGPDFVLKLLKEGGLLREEADESSLIQTPRPENSEDKPLNRHGGRLIR